MGKVTLPCVVSASATIVVDADQIGVPDTLRHIFHRPREFNDYPCAKFDQKL
jgi:hypothetical protein